MDKGAPILGETDGIAEVSLIWSSTSGCCDWSPFLTFFFFKKNQKKILFILFYSQYLIFPKPLRYKVQSTRPLSKLFRLLSAFLLEVDVKCGELGQAP